VNKLSTSEISILFDQESVLGNIKREYNELARLLVNLDFNIIEMSSFDEQLIGRARVLVIPAKTYYKYEKEELAVLRDFLVRGGSLLIMFDKFGDVGLVNNLEEITALAGIFPRCDIVRGERSSVVIINTFNKVDSITFGVEKIIYPEGCSFIIKQRAHTKPIAITSPRHNPPNAPVIVISRYGNGRLGVIGSYKMFSNDWIKHYDNAQIFVNILFWLIGEKKKIPNVRELIIKEVSVKKELLRIPEIEREFVKKEIQEARVKPGELIEKVERGKREEGEKYEEFKDLRSIAEGLKNVQSQLDELFNKVTSLESNLLDIIKKTAERQEEILNLLKDIINRLNERINKTS